ncbi:hypothetical protein ACHAXR_007399 [Thalassiosira sp. AJA248-18]
MRRTCPNTATALLAAAAAAALATTTSAFSTSLLSSGAATGGSGSAHHKSSSSRHQRRENVVAPLQLSSLPPDIQLQPTELPDSLSDAAAIAANACNQLYTTAGTTIRCRVDFDTSIGDETYTTLKSSTDFMQQFVSSLCLASVEGVREWKMDSAMKAVQAKAELRELREKMEGMGMMTDDEDDGEELNNDNNEEEEAKRQQLAEKETQLLQIIANDGTDPSYKWTGPNVRIYFPDEGSAALARRDWKSQVPPCVQFSSCGGVQVADVSRDAIILFFCPRASEAEFVEEILYKTEESRGDGLIMSVMINPLLVDMGVTGFGMAGRRLRERLIDGLVPAYYLRTLPWGALTRVWPQMFTVWQEDEVAEGGYRMIKAMDRLPSNPEVEDIYDIENGDMRAPQEGLGFLNALGDFVNGMTKL